MIEPTLRPPPHKGAYIFPNLLTAGNLFAGFYAIVTAMNLHFERAAVAIIIAAFMDGLDGKIARMTGTSSRFGVEFDSLADLVSFGVAPALLVYIFELKRLRAHRLGRGLPLRGLRRAAPRALQRAGRHDREALVHRPADPDGRGDPRRDRALLPAPAGGGTRVLRASSSCC